MPFEPLNTDETLEAPVERTPDMDSAMLFGCSGFVFTSIVGYLLAVWPFLVFPAAERFANIGIAAGAGLAPSGILGCFATRKFGLAGACGFVGSSLAMGIFLYLRLDEAFLAALARQAPSPDYPRLMEYLIPIGWILLSAILALITLPRDKGES